MRSNEFITEAERPGLFSRGWNRVKAAMGSARAGGQLDVQNFYKTLKASFDRWIGQAGLTYGSTLTGKDIAAKMGDKVMLAAMQEVGIRGNTVVTKPQAENLVHTYAEMKLSGRAAKTHAGLPTPIVKKPTTPAAKPTTPAAKPTTPAAKPTTPAAKPTAPAAKPTAPAAKPTAPA
jgi:hypothetical protein